MYSKEQFLRLEKYGSYGPLLSYHLLWDTLYKNHSLIYRAEHNNFIFETTYYYVVYNISYYIIHILMIIEKCHNLYGEVISLCKMNIFDVFESVKFNCIQFLSNLSGALHIVNIKQVYKNRINIFR